MSLAWRESGDPVDAEFPVYLTTGRVVSQYLSGHADAPHRGAGGSVPRAESGDPSATGGAARHPQWRLGHGHLPPRPPSRCEAMVVRTIRPDTVFIPYHWPGGRSANRLTHRTLDPRSKIPEYKVSACRIEKSRGSGRATVNVRYGVLCRPVALHRLPVLPEGLRRVRDTPRRFHDQFRFRGPAAESSPQRLTFAGTATIPRAPRFARRMPSRNTRMALWDPRSSRAASAAPIACWHARSGFPNWCRNTSR